MKETRKSLAELYFKASEEARKKDPIKNFKVYFEEFKNDFKKPQPEVKPKTEVKGKLK